MYEQIKNLGKIRSFMKKHWKECPENLLEKFDKTIKELENEDLSKYQ